MKFILLLALCFAFTEAIRVVEFPKNVYEAAVHNVDAVWSVMSSMFVQVDGNLEGPCEGVLHGWKRTLSALLVGENFCMNLEGTVEGCIQGCRLPDPWWIAIDRKYIKLKFNSDCVGKC